MFGVNKKKQAKSVEEFLRSQDAAPPSAVRTTTDSETGGPAMKRWFVAPAVVAGALLVLLCAAFVKIGALKSDVALLRLQTKSDSMENLKAQVAALVSKVNESDKEAALLKADIARLEKNLREMKLMSIRKQKAETAAKKPALDKKKPVGRKT